MSEIICVRSERSGKLIRAKKRRSSGVNFALLSPSLGVIWQ